MGTTEIDAKQWQREFSIKLAHRMSDLDLNQHDLARISGVNQPAISMYINEKRVPSAFVAFKLAVALGMDLGNLIGFRGDM